MEDAVALGSFADVVQAAVSSSRRREELRRDAKLYFLLAAEFSGQTVDLVSFLGLKEVLAYRFSYGGGGGGGGGAKEDDEDGDGDGPAAPAPPPAPPPAPAPPAAPGPASENCAATSWKA